MVIGVIVLIGVMVSVAMTDRSRGDRAAPSA